MPNGYPCPACGDADAPLFARDTMHVNEGHDDTHAAASAPYACEACLSAAGVKSAGPAIMNADVTSLSQI
jgi:hypothetical protein